MSLRRLFAPQLPAAKTQLSLGEESRQHAQVLRLGPGDPLQLFDAAGGRAEARVLRCDKRELMCEVEPAEHVARLGPALTLAVCVPKASKLELIVRMATELGVAGVQLVQSERAVPKFGSEAPKLERLRRITLEACAQSEQAYAPELSGPLPLTAALAHWPADACKLACVERSRAAAWPDVTAACPAVCVVVGPEGGFTAAELSLFTQAGVQPVSLGDAILRVETACVVACALALERVRAAAAG